MRELRSQRARFLAAGDELPPRRRAVTAALADLERARGALTAAQSGQRDETHAQLGMAAERARSEAAVTEARSRATTEQAEADAARNQRILVCETDPSTSACGANVRVEAEEAVGVERARAALRVEEARFEALDARTTTAGRSVNDLGFAVAVAQTDLERVQSRLTDARTALERTRTRRETAEAAIRAQREQPRTARRDLGQARDALRRARAANEQSVTTATSSLSAARASLAVTRADGAVEVQPTRRGELADARAAVARARRALAEADRAVRATELRAPAAGTVARVNGRVGELADAASAEPGALAPAPDGQAAASAVTAEGGATEPIVRLVDVGTMRVVARFNERDAARVRRNDPATVSVDALESTRLPARVSRVAPTSVLVNGVVAYEVTLVLRRGARGLRPGQTVQAEVRVADATDVLVLPRAAAPAAAAATRLRVLTPDRLRTRDVVLGLEGDTGVEVRAGLRAGERVVLAGPTG